MNDGICDCCDASDEYKASSRCINNCLQLGEASREERRRYLQLLREGSEIRNQYIDQAKQRRVEEESELKRLKHEWKEAEAIRLEKDAVKRAAEEKETAALAKYKELEEAKKQELEEQEFRKNEVKEQLAAEQAFKELDTDHDNLLTFTELKNVPVFDQDADGSVSDDEAKFFLHMKDTMSMEEWKTIGWVIAKPYILKMKQDTHDPDVITAAPLDDHHIDDDLDDLEMFGDKKDEDLKHETHEEEEEEEDEDDPGQHYTHPADPISEPPKGLPSVTTTEFEYDDETKALIEEARKAKEEYNDADSKFSSTSQQVQNLEKSLETDFGPDDSFLPLYGQCFEMTDREYVYKLCPFDKASQRPKDGGSETSLGRWGRWIHTDDQKYHRMKYEGGATCWNGPARSVDVIVHCGLTNEITSAGEPNRCEYTMEFYTPALCLKEESIMTDSHEKSHEEL